MALMAWPSTRQIVGNGSTDAPKPNKPGSLGIAGRQVPTAECNSRTNVLPRFELIEPSALVWCAAGTLSCH